jgi:hypothetical protein
VTNPDAVAGYRAAREAQLERFEAACNSADRSCTDTPEYREYFGLGEYAGSGTEVLVTFKDWLVAGRRPADALEDAPEPLEDPTTYAGLSAESAFWLTGADLAELAAAGDVGASAEIARRTGRRAAKRAARLLVSV